MSLNKVMLIGRVGNPPEIKHLDSGVDVAKFSLATSDRYKNKNGESIEQTEWHTIIIWGKLALIIEQYVNKGDKLYIEGKVKTRSWDDKDGRKKYVTEIYSDKIEMLGNSKSQGQTQNDSRIDDELSEPYNDQSSDLPF